MFNKKSSRHSLALFVALTLGSGTFLAPSAASAVDVSGQNVEIDDTHAPSNNAIDPGGGPAFGTAAGFIANVADSGNIMNNILTFNGLSAPYGQQLFGGLTFGLGNVTGNRIIVNPTTLPLLSSVEGIYGGAAEGGGSVQNNHAVFNGNHLNNDMAGGMTRTNGTGIVQGNTATLKGGSAHANIYGGMAVGGANGDVIGNTATIEGGTITGAGKIYGGYTDGTGKVTGNTARVTGGTAKDVYGGRSQSGDAEGNTAKVTGGSAQDVYGGRSQSGDPDGNSAEISGGTARTTYGGYSSGMGKATNNTATLTGGTLSSDIYGGVAASGDAVKNTVNIKGGSAAGHDVYGGFSTSGNATGNIVNITGGSVRNVDGGRSASGNATGNIVNIGSADAAFGGSITGIINGGSGTTYGNDYRTGNKLNVYGNATASNIRNFAEINFHFNAHVNQFVSFLTLNDGGGTTIESLNDLNVDGEHGRKGVLLQNTPGSITIADGQNRRIKTSDNKELILEKSTDNKKITYEGYQFANATAPTTVTEGGVTSTWGGHSKAGNTTTENTITVASGTHTNIYGGWTTGSGSTAAADKQKNSTANKVKVNGSANVTGTVYGGFTNVAGGKAQNNEVTIEKNLAANIVGGKSTTGEASNNTVNLANATVSAVTGGEGAATNNNTVNLNGGANVTGALKGGSAANGTGNTLNVKGVNSAGSVTGFQKMNFDATGASTNAAMLRTTGATDVNWEMLTVKNAVASEKPLTLLENANGINISDRTGDAVKSELNADATMETNIDVRQSGSTITAITYEGYTFKGATQATTYGADTWAGRSKAGNTTQDNKLTLSDASKTYANVYGGWTSGTGTKAAADKQNNSLNNTVDYTAGTVTSTLYGGYAANGEASGNTVNLGTVTTAANIYGGFGTVTKNNTINLKGARVTGTVTGGSQANGTGNTLAVYKPSEVHDFAAIQNLHFYTDEMAAGAATPMLKLGTATKDIRGLNIGVARSGAAPKLNKGDKILLMKTAGGALTTDATIQNKVEGMQGVSRRYEYEIKQEATGELTATVTKAGLAEQAKSLVETRAGLASFVNQGADYLVQDGLAAAQMSVSASDADKGGKNAQRKAVASDGAAYQLWAGAGANSMRAESGSYVDSKGWNLGVGWAREDVQKDGAKVLFSPFVEYGRGTYDSYLDDGTHGNGKISYIGAGILGKLTQKDGLWLEGSLRAGRAKSDYSANLSGTAASYDGSNTYYGAHLGAGKTFAIKEGSSIDAYARYFWSHQNSMTATLNTGDRYEFGSVNSQRLRLGFRYSRKDKTTGEFYAGLAWEHEFAGKAGATYEGDAAPSPSLKGSSYMLELGYRFMPENSRVSYDLHLNGWQGQRKGITGGASVKWAF